jgi:hypothetical protein
MSINLLRIFVFAVQFPAFYLPAPHTLPAVATNYALDERDLCVVVHAEYLFWN